MKRILLLFAFLASFFCYADKFKIIKLNPSPVIIGGKEKTINSTFNDNEPITWKYDKQGMWVSDETNGGYRYFSKEAFNAAGANTAFSYLKTNHPSTRGGFELLPYTKAAYNSEKRFALVIGNSNYSFEKSLRNPIADATDIADNLRALGFDVLIAYDADYNTMNAALEKYKATSQGYATTLFYYAGHGQQYKGQTYLLPIDANVSTEYDIRNMCVPGPRVVSFMNEVKANTNIAIIDACRSDKALLRDTQNEDLHMDAPDNGIVLFSTKSGEPASDGDGYHSPFAEALLNNIVKENISLLDLVTQVTNDVKESTASLHTQTPNCIQSLDHKFYFSFIQSPQYTSVVPPIDTIASTASQSSTSATHAYQKTPNVDNNGHGFVDLGLSVLWATCNVGANKPEDYGDYFSWGETSTKINFSLINYIYYNRKGGFYKYNEWDISHYNMTKLEPSDDAASVNWGGSWRMPDNTEWQELKNNCKFIWTKHNGVKGCEVFGPNGNSIFLPAAGGYYYDNDKIRYKGKRCQYWLSDLTLTIGKGPYSFQIRDDKHFGSALPITERHNRHEGFTIRPVCPKN